MKTADSINPTNYRLAIEPDFKNFTFKGSVRISLKISKPTSKITLNSIELKLLEAIVEQKGQKIKVKNIKLDEKEEEAELELEEELKKGEAFLAISYSGILNDKLHG